MIESEIKTLVLEQLKISEEPYSEELMAGDIPEWDSLAHVNLLMAVEKHFSIVFDVGDAIDIESVGDLIDAVKRATQPPS
ncbi:MAG: acyl carrier protein [Verrucomicrobiota bacterium]